MTIFVGIVGSCIVVSYAITAVGCAEVMAFLNERIVAVEINEKPFLEPKVLLTDIRSIDTSAFRYHHSYAGRKYPMLLRGEKESMLLYLARDSSDPHEYWVFYPSFNITSANDIGEFRTTALDKVELEFR